MSLVQFSIFLVLILPSCYCFTHEMSTNCANRTWLLDEDCECAHVKSLDGFVYCDSTKEVFLFSWFCMAYDERVGEEVVGRCPYTYTLFSDRNVSNVGLYVKLPPTVDQLETFMCDRLNRKGFFCGKCKKNYGYAMYPDFLKCVECDPKNHVRNWLLYVVISYVPLTVFLILVVCLRISATSAPMNAFIFISQIISHPPFLRGFSHTIDTTFLSHGARMFMKFLLSLYSLWNLNYLHNSDSAFLSSKSKGLQCHIINLSCSLVPSAPPLPHLCTH